MIRFVLLACLAVSVSAQCNPTPTTVSGSAAPGGALCSGALIFEDNFDYFDGGKWSKENTLSGGGNWEFQWYSTNEENLHTANGNLVLNPTLMTDRFGEGILTSGEFSVEQFGPCTDDRDYGCARTGNDFNILNPLISGKIQSRDQFAFKYGRVEFRVRLPAGDWLWPAVWAMPKDSVYGGWPHSGEIDMMEGRGNRGLYSGVHIGSQQVASTLHNSNGYRSIPFNSPAGFVDDFHVYTVTWTPDSISFGVDGQSGILYDTAHPFDQEFYLIINLAVGGMNGYFPDGAENPGGKPWSNASPNGMTNFWEGRGQWLPTWDNHLKTMEVDYIRVWAL